jgi:GR25 family glycosyltransferase involved in LPS biosynthesis
MDYNIYLINMDKSTERLSFMSSQLQSLSLPFIRQPGVDGKTHDFSSLYDENYSTKHNGGPLSPVELGCALSHRHAIEKIAQGENAFGIVLEDDVELPQHFKEIIESLIQKHSQGITSWDYIAFNYPSVGFKYIRLWLFLFGGLFRRNQTLSMYLKLPIYAVKFFGVVLFSCFEWMRESFYRHLYTYGAPAKFYRELYLAGCYLITKEGAQKLLSVDEKLVYPADRLQHIAKKKCGLRLYYFVPLLVKQRRDKFKSTMNDLDLSEVMNILQ